MAFTSSSEPKAWWYATHASNNTLGRARVYEVEPHPNTEVGTYNPAHPNFWRSVSRRGSRENWDEYTAPHFTVTGVHDIIPGRQGTFPQINWRQFSTRGNSQMYDPNHPTPNEVEHGTPGSTMYREHLLGAHGVTSEKTEPRNQGKQLSLFEDD